MAKVILDSGDTFVAASTVSIFGSTGAETVKVQDGVTATVDTSVERIEFTGASSAYTFKSTPTGVSVMSGTTVVANVANGNKLSFSDGSVTVAVGFSGGAVTYTVGGATVTGTAAALTGATVNTAAAEKSTITAAPTAVVGQTFTLTASSDVKTGTSANDTFNGTVGALNAADVLADGSTTDADVLNAVSNAVVAAGTASATITNIETLNISGQYVTTGVGLLNTTGSKVLNVSAGIEGATATINDASATAVTSIVSGTNVQTLDIATNATTTTTGGTLAVNTGSASSVTITGKAGADAYDLTLGSAVSTLGLTAAAGVDAFTVKLVGNTTTLTVDNGNIETLTLNSTGAANTVTLAASTNVLTGAAATGYKTVITGDQNFTLVGGSTDGNLQAALSTLSIQDTSSAVTTIKTGSKAANAPANLDLSKATVDVLNIATTDYFIAALNGNTMTINDGTTLKLSADATGTTGGIIQVQNAAGTIANTAGKLGTLTLDVAKTQTGAMTTGDQVGTLTMSNASATAAVTMASLVLDNNTDAVNLTGSYDMTITSLTTGDGSTFAASGFTGKLNVGTIVGDDSIVVGGSGNDTITATTATLTGLVVNGGAGNDFINASALTVASTAGGAVLAGGTGNDTITGGEIADTITGGDGDDLITGGIGLDIMTGGTGNDTFVFATTSTGAPSDTAFDTINDWASGDKVDFAATVALVATTAAAASTLASISATGFASFYATDTTLLQKLTAVSNAALIANEAVVFASGSDSYLFISEGTTGLDATDVVVKLVGVTATTGMVLDGSGDIITIA